MEKPERKEVGTGSQVVVAVGEDDVIEVDTNQTSISKRCKLEGGSEGSVVEVGGRGGININPMMIELVLQKVFRFHMDSIQDLKNFRLVCKTWGGEVKKALRNKTEIDINHLIYPLSGLHQDPVLDYDHTTPFKNVRLRGCCETLQDPNIVKWFKSNGVTIKCLRFRSSLACYHHTRFLECVLKLWCKNLKSLHLDGVHSFTTFNHFSRFDKAPFICELEELLVYGETDALRNTEDCGKHLETCYLNFNDDSETHVVQHRRGGRYWDEHDARFVGILQMLARSADDPDIKEGIEQIDQRFGTDGGVFGQLLEKNGIQRLVIRNLSKRNFFLNTFARNPKTVSTLKCFEFGNFQMFLWEDHFQAIQNLHLSLTKIVIGSLMTHMSSEWISGLLASYRNTLHHLEFSGNVVLWDLITEEEREYISIDIPLLPHLKTFVNGNIFCTRLTGLDFVKSLPKLEKCSLTNAISHSSIFPLNPSQVFNLLFQAAAFENYQHSLRELHLDGKITFTRHVEMLRDWFPKLKKVDLILEGTDVFVEFFQVMKRAELEDIKLSFYSNDNEWCNAGIANSMVHMKSLKFLELIHLADHPLVITAGTCFNGLARAPLLTSLKLDNFGMFIDEVSVIRESLSKICCVKFANCVLQHRPAQVEFSVCRVEIPDVVQRCDLV